MTDTEQIAALKEELRKVTEAAKLLVETVDGYEKMVANLLRINNQSLITCIVAVVTGIAGWLLFIAKVARIW